MTGSIGRRWLGAGAGLVLAGALALGLPAVWTHATASGRLFDPATVPAHDVAIVFGAEVYADGTPAPFTAARLDRALEVYRAGRARVLIVSGNNAEAHHFETTNMRRYLIERGVPPAKVVEDVAGNDSYDTCRRVRDTFGVASAILISQSYHLPRALTTCQALGVAAVGVGDDSVRHRDFWRVGVAREVPANLKMIKDIVTQRPPEIASPPSDAVGDALRA